MELCLAGDRNQVGKVRLLKVRVRSDQQHISPLESDFWRYIHHYFRKIKGSATGSRRYQIYQ